jgi:nitrite reductase (NADH) small subunit
MGKWMTVASAGQLKDGEGLVVPVATEEVALFRIEGRVYACTNVCPHRGGPLGDGSLDGKVVSCPWHGWEFNVTTGRMPVNPNVGVKTYPAQVVDGDVQIEV